jgi:hypothetical protein
MIRVPRATAHSSQVINRAKKVEKFPSRHAHRIDAIRVFLRDPALTSYFFGRFSAISRPPDTAQVTDFTSGIIFCVHVCILRLCM